MRTVDPAGRSFAIPDSNCGGTVPARHRGAPAKAGLARGGRVFESGATAGAANLLELLA